MMQVGALVRLSLVSALVLGACGAPPDAGSEGEDLELGSAQRELAVPVPTAAWFGVHDPYLNKSDAYASDDMVGADQINLRNLAVSTLDGDWPMWAMGPENDRGRKIHITWMPKTASGTNTNTAIANGQYDGVLRAAATTVKGLGFPIIIRLGHEMNGRWFPWGHQPAEFIRMFRHVVTLFRNNGVTNADFEWCPSGGAHNQAKTTSDLDDMIQYYPGNSYVDWIGVDNYNRGAPSWQTLDQMIGKWYGWAKLRGKPLIIAETGSVEGGTATAKASWVRDALNRLKTQFTSPPIRGWIHQQYDDGTYDWRMNSSPAALDAYRAFVRDPFFQ